MLPEVDPDIEILFILIGCAKNLSQQFPPWMYDISQTFLVLGIDPEMEKACHPHMHPIRASVGTDVNKPNISWSDLVTYIDKWTAHSLVVIEQFTGSWLFQDTLQFKYPDKVQLHFVPYSMMGCFPPVDDKWFKPIVEDGRLVQLANMTPYELIERFKDTPHYYYHLGIYLEYLSYQVRNYWHYEFRHGKYEKLSLVMAWTMAMTPILKTPSDLDDQNLAPFLKQKSEEYKGKPA